MLEVFVLELMGCKLDEVLLVLAASVDWRSGLSFLLASTSCGEPRTAEHDTQSAHGKLFIVSVQVLFCF